MVQAASGGHTNCLKTLLDADAAKDLQSSAGYTALMLVSMIFEPEEHWTLALQCLFSLWRSCKHFVLLNKAHRFICDDKK